MSGREKLGQTGKGNAMRFRLAYVALAFLCVGIYLIAASNRPPVSPDTRIAQPAPEVPAEIAALSGVWEGLGPDDLPIRLIVESIRGHLASVVYTWGDHPEGKFYRGWLRVRATVSPDGKLFWRHPGEFTFQLSDDWTTLMGKREQAGKTATSLMRRVPMGTALTALSMDDTQ
jgi:hypothetical protein